MSIREIIKIKIINDLVRELAHSLNIPESDIPSLLEKPKVKSKLDLEAEHYLDMLQKKIVIEELKCEVNKLEATLNQLRLDLKQEIKEELKILEKIVYRNNIQSTISISNPLILKNKIAIKELIQKNETEQAMQILLGACKGNSDKSFNEVIVHYSKLDQLLTDIRIGKISREQEVLERNKINNDLLSLIDAIKI